MSAAESVPDKLARNIGAPTESGCWPWIGTRDDRGYGRTTINSRFTSAHRAVYRVARGPIPFGLQIDHLCRNPSCVNPYHLEAVSLRTNVLRGVGISAQNARKEACTNGHPLSGDNLRITKEGHRSCKECSRHYTRLARQDPAKRQAQYDRSNAVRRAKYVPKRPKMNIKGFELYRAHDGGWRWRLKTTRIIAVASESYSSKTKALKGFRSAAKLSAAVLKALDQ